MKQKKRNIIIAVIMLLTVLILMCIDKAVNNEDIHSLSDSTTTSVRTVS